jgi:hypothetical protein
VNAWNWLRKKMQKRPARADSPDHFYVNPILGAVSGVLLAIGSMTVLLIAGWFYAGTSNQGGGSAPGTRSPGCQSACGSVTRWNSELSHAHRRALVRSRRS